MTVDIRKALFKTAVSAGISLAVLAFLFRLLSGAAPAEALPGLVTVLRSVVPGLLALYVVSALLQAHFRAMRYRVLIAAAGEQPPRLRHVYLVTLTRNMLVDLLPARLGELSYIAMMNRGYRVGAETCFSSLAISTVFDVIALVFVVGAILLGGVVQAANPAWLLPALIGVSVLAALMLVCVYGLLPVGISLLKRIFGTHAEKGLLKRMFGFLATLNTAVQATRQAGVLAKVLSLSLCIRAVKYSGLYCIFHAVVNPSFPSLADISFAKVLAALLGAEAGASLPIPALMSFGTYEAGGVLALTLLGVSAAVSRTSMLAVHVWSQAADYTLGGVGLVVFVLTAGSACAATTTRSIRTRTKRIVLCLFAAGLLATGSGLLFLQHRKLQKQGALNPPAGGGALPRPTDETAQLRSLTKDLRGFIVWSSNRFGNHDLVMLSLPDLKLSRLTTHPHVDTFPRISPDGRSIVFCRSQTEWVSQRNPLPWDVYLLDRTTGEERLLARNANTPTWSEDGRHVTFQQNGDTFVKHNLDSGKERVLFAAGQGAVPAGVSLQTPSFSTATKAMAVTLRGATRATAVFFEDGSALHVGGGCQLAWTRQPGTLCYVDGGGRGKNMVYAYDRASEERRPWLDLAGELSHEYFPMMSNDGRYLVLGASRGGRKGHEHDTADYEIFLWRIGDAAERAARVTFHSGNDCWPDMFVEQGGSEGDRT